MKTIAEYWASFERDVVPPAADAVQRREMRRSFYAGALSAFNLVTNIPEDATEEAGCARLDALDAEFKRYAQDLIDGRA